MFSPEKDSIAEAYIKLNEAKNKSKKFGKFTISLELLGTDEVVAYVNAGKDSARLEEVDVLEKVGKTSVPENTIEKMFDWAENNGWTPNENVYRSLKSSR